MVVIAYTDGASSGNPGPSGIGIVLYQDEAKIKEISESIGKGTSNIAEYKAVIRALEEADKLKDNEIILRSDSQLVIRQLNNEYNTHNQKLRTLLRRAIALCEGKKISFEHVARGENEDADRLARKAIPRSKSRSAGRFSEAQQKL